MILQQKIASSNYTFPKVYTEPAPLKKQQELTIPGQAIDLKHAMNMYRRGSLEERAKGFYEAKGFEMPDFDRMSKVERLGELNKFSKEVKRLSQEIQNINTKNNEILAEKQKAKARHDQGSTARPDTVGKDGSDKQGK